MNCKVCQHPLAGPSPEQICCGCKMEELLSELTRLKTPPRCPACGSQVMYSSAYANQTWLIFCESCGHRDRGDGGMLDALNSWRTVKDSLTVPAIKDSLNTEKGEMK